MQFLLPGGLLVTTGEIIIIPITIINGEHFKEKTADCSLFFNAVPVSITIFNIAIRYRTGTVVKVLSSKFLYWL